MRVTRTIIISKASSLKVITGIVECGSSYPHQVVLLIQMDGSHVSYGMIVTISQGLQVHKRITVVSAEPVRCAQPDIPGFILYHVVDTVGW